MVASSRDEYTSVASNLETARVVASRATRRAIELLLGSFVDHQNLVAALTGSFGEWFAIHLDRSAAETHETFDDGVAAAAIDSSNIPTFDLTAISLEVEETYQIYHTEEALPWDLSLRKGVETAWESSEVEVASWV